NHGLRLDLDSFARLGVAAHARLAVRFHGAADIGNDELARAALAFLNREFKELFEKERRGFLRCGTLLGDMGHDFALAHWLSCHLFCLSSCFYFPPRWELGQAASTNPGFGVKKLGPQGTIAKAKRERKG